MAGPPGEQAFGYSSRNPEVDSSGRSKVNPGLRQLVLDAREVLGRQTQLRRDIGLGSSVTIDGPA